MGKRKGNNKRSLGSLPKGLVHRKGAKPSDPGNPFEMTARMKRPKHEVHNRPVSKPKNTKHALESLQLRQAHLRTSLKSGKKSNVMVDQRIGEYNPKMTTSDQMLARLVKERTRQSHRSTKFRLDDEDNDMLTHKGKKLDPSQMEAIYSDDEDDNGQLEAADTELHFGGAGIKQAPNPYGASAPSDLAQVYGQRKTELDDLIFRRKSIKADKMLAKEAQADVVEKLDETFGEFSNLLMFRKDQARPAKEAEPTQEEKEMNEWNKEMKAMMLTPKKKATDRTKTPEEIAKEEAERLHKLETRRLARMNGDFEEDELSDISLDGRGRSRKATRNASRNPDELTDDEESVANDDKLEARFTADGIKYIDRDGNIVDPDTPETDDESSESSKDDGGALPRHPLSAGTRVQGNYRATEQFDGREAWYDAEITKVHVMKDGTVRYDVEYADGDFEEDMLPENVRPLKVAIDHDEKDPTANQELKLKQNKARDKARTEMPYVFEVPTTLESFNELIAKYANTGKDVTTIVERIHRANSVRLNHKNTEKMQNFYDVLLRRLVAVGDAYYNHGDGGEELGRVDQLNKLTKMLFLLAQEFPEAAGAVWSRRIGVLQSAHEKRLRDLELVVEGDEEESPWPSAGVFLLLKASTAIFPATDRKHFIVTPVNLFLGQILAQTPILSAHDALMGILCAALLLDNCLEAKRVATEALGFVSGIVRLFSNSPDHFALPAFESAYHLLDIQTLRSNLQTQKGDLGELSKLKLEAEFISSLDGKVASAILNACFQIIDKVVAHPIEGISGFGIGAELFAEMSASLLTLRPKDLPQVLRQKLSATASQLAALCQTERQPLRRKTGVLQDTTGIKTLAPRMEDPERYSMSKDTGKKSVQVAIDRTRREYKREHKAISRELRTDGAFIESERRKEREAQDSKARAKRQKNFAWLEGEAATLNQQVAQGGGLLKGGGIGAAKAKARSGKLGIKKGGKF